MSRRASIVSRVGILALVLVPLLGCPGFIFIYNGAFGGQIAVVGCVGTCATVDRSVKPVRLVLVQQGDVVTGQMFMDGRATNVTGTVNAAGELSLRGDIGSGSLRDWKSSMAGGSMSSREMKGTFSSYSIDSSGLATRVDFRLISMYRE